MKPVRMIYHLFLMSLLNVATVASAEPTTQPTNSPASGAIEAIRQAVDPSSAVQAFARSPDAAGNPAILHAFVQRMVDFGLPEMSESQARELISRNSNDALGLAVVAYMNAKRDDPSGAMSHIVRAVKNGPQDTFVIRTAGQLLAWFDTRVERDRVPAQVAIDVQAMREQLGNNQDYRDSYARAWQSYRELSDAPATQPAEQNVAETSTAPVVVAAPPPVYRQSPTYYGTSVDNSWLNDDYYYPVRYGVGYAWWPTCVSPIIVNREVCDRHRGFANRFSVKCFDAVGWGGSFNGNHFGNLQNRNWMNDGLGRGNDWRSRGSGTTGRFAPWPGDSIRTYDPGVRRGMTGLNTPAAPRMTTPLSPSAGRTSPRIVSSPSPHIAGTPRVAPARPTSPVRVMPAPARPGQAPVNGGARR